MFAFQENHETILKRDRSYEEDLKQWTDDLNTHKKPVGDIYEFSGTETEQNLSLVREISTYLQQRVSEEDESKAEEKEAQVEKTAVDLYAEEDKKDATEEENLNLAKGKTAVKSEIQNFFAGQKVLVTGGTGFLGKVIIEKLLRSCRDVDKIYVLVRAKKGKDPVTRVQELLGDVVFKRVITENPRSVYKVVPICGDTSQPGLGLTDADRKLLTDGVSIIIHSAATVRFDDPLRSAAAVNVRGTRELVSLARLCRRLQVITHVSTAYANCTRQDLEERFYEPPMDPDNLLAISHLDESILTEITPKLLGKFPNTYTYTKAIAEQVVKKYGEGMPVCIVRPAIIVSTYEEPIRGWIDNIYGPTGALFGAGIGVLRVLWGIRDNKAELVPVDYTANAVIAATCDTAKRFQHNQTSDIPIYNFVCGEHKQISWGQFIEINKECGIKVPSMKCVWYNGFNLVSNYYVYLLYNFFLQLVPALIADTILVIMRRKTRFLDLYRKIKRFSDVLAYFLHRQWNFHNINTRNLYSRISNADKAIFPFDMTKMSWEYHAEMQFKGLRVYYVKDDMSTLAEATTRYRKLYIIHQVVKALAAVLAINVVYWILYTIYNAIFE